MTPRAIEQLTDRVAHTEWLDKVGGPLADRVSGLVPAGTPVKDLLSGTWLGHPLHPMLTDLPIGFWTSAMAVDFLGGRKGHRAADRLVALGVLTALPTAAAGLADWSDTIGEDKRLGVAHAAGNVVATALYGWSWLARKRGRRGMGVTLGVLGAGAATAGAYLGGHLAWRKGVNVDRHAWDHPTDDWSDVPLDPALAAGEPMVVGVGDDTVLVVAGDGATPGSDLTAISDVCSHMGGPLHEGPRAGGCATCPWHGSSFRLVDGSVVHGPATGPQPAYDVRRSEDRLALRRRPVLTPPEVLPPPTPPTSPPPPDTVGNATGRNGSSASPADAVQP